MAGIRPNFNRGFSLGPDQSRIARWREHLKTANGDYAEMLEQLIAEEMAKLPRQDSNLRPSD